MEDKKKILILCIVIAFIIVLIVCLGIIAYLSYQAENAPTSNSNRQTTTRRNTVSSEAIIDDDTTSSVTTSTVPMSSGIASSNTSSNSSTTRISSAKTTSSRYTTKTSTRTVTVTGPTIIITEERPTHPVTDGESNYPNALNDWEWEIVEMINEERRSNGLDELEVASDLRTLAEEAADYWDDFTESELKAYLAGNSYYAKKSNNLNHNNGYLSLYQDTISKTKVTTRDDLRYLGVGVIYKENGFNGIPTHYYVIIYE